GTADDDGTGPVPLTPIMRWWRGMGGPTAGFHQSVLLRTPGTMREPQLAAVLQALLDRHDMLRSRLAQEPGGEAVLEVPKAGGVRAADVLTRVDAAGLTDAALDAETVR